MLPDIRSQTRESLADKFAEWGQPAYRLEQLLGWLYPRRAASWDWRLVADHECFYQSKERSRMTLDGDNLFIPALGCSLWIVER